MTTINIAYEVPKAVIADIQNLLDKTARTDINWNGADFKIERDDFTCIPDNESPDAAILLRQILGLIDEATRNPRNAGRKPKSRTPCGWRLAPEVIKAVAAHATTTGQSQNDAAEELLRKALTL